MDLKQEIADELKRLAGFTTVHPKTVALSGPDRIDIEIDFTAVDSMSCSLREIRLHVPSLVGCHVDTLKSWAQSLSNRVNYLLENLGPIEIDTNAGTVLIRSTPPDQQLDGTQFYEILLESNTTGNFLLRRYESVKGTSGRTQVDMQVTHEVLKKLVSDLVETVPAP